MLQEQADTSDSNPAAETHKERFAACFHQLHDVGIETDGCHGQYDEELGKFFDRRKEVSRTPIEAAMVVMMEAAMK